MGRESQPFNCDRFNVIYLTLLYNYIFGETSFTASEELKSIQ